MPVNQPKFVQRLARLPEVVNVIASYPEGVSVGALAAQFDVAPDQLHQDLVTFMEMDSMGWDHGVFDGRALEFVADWDPADDADVFDLDTDTDDPSAVVVQVVSDAPARAMGVEHLTAGDLALLYSAGQACLDTDPDDEHLAAALEVIAETMYGVSTGSTSAGVVSTGSTTEGLATETDAEQARLLPLLQDAQEQRRRVDIVYSRTWAPGVGERTIEPLRLVQTIRGWEVDAGPVQDDGNLRTYLLSNIRSASVTEEEFEPPRDAATRLEVQRRTTSVRLSLEQAARWAPDVHAERVEVLSEDEHTFECDLDLLPPAAERVALLLLASGGEARVLENHALMREASEVIEALIEHHERPVD